MIRKRRITDFDIAISSYSYMINNVLPFQISNLKKQYNIKKNKIILNEIKELEERLEHFKEMYYKLIEF